MYPEAELLYSLGIGSTPLIPIGAWGSGTLSLKAEFLNPFGSVKDRTAAYLLEDARKVAGEQVTIVESTSGNLGVALAGLGRILGNHTVLVMDASIPQERIRYVERHGGEIVVVAEPYEGLDMRQSRIRRAEEMGNRPGHRWVNQYSNPAGPLAHAQTTGPEIWHDTGGEVQAIVAAAGTGGTICGIGRFMKSVAPETLIVAVEPEDSTIFGGEDAPYLPAGAGLRGPSPIVREMLPCIDYAAKIPDRVAAGFAYELQQRIGLKVGLTTGAAIAVGTCLARDHGMQVVAIAPDRGLGFEAIIPSLAAEALRPPSITLSPVSPGRQPIAGRTEVPG